MMSLVETTGWLDKREKKEGKKTTRSVYDGSSSLRRGPSPHRGTSGPRWSYKAKYLFISRSAN